MLLLLKYWKLGAIALILVSYPLVAWYYYDKGKSVEYAACEKARFEAFQLGSESRKEIDINVKRLTVTDVDKLLTDNQWMRQH